MPLPLLLIPLEALIFAPPVAIGIAAAKKQPVEQVSVQPNPPVSTGQARPALPFAIEPGHWEYRMELRTADMPVALAPPARQRCLTAADIAENKHLLSDNTRNQCRFEQQPGESGRQAMAFSCSNKEGEISGRIVGNASPATLELEAALHLQPARQGISDMTQKIMAKRLGNCPEN